MAETETAVVEPIAETSAAPEPEPFEETAAQESVETAEGDTPETQSFTEEQLAERERAAVEKALAELEDKRNDEAYRARLAESEGWIRNAAYEHGEQYFRRVAAQGAKWAEEGKTQQEAAALVQRVHIKQFLDEFANSVAPTLTYDTHQAHLGVMQKLTKEWFPGAKVGDEVEAKFKESQNSGKADTAIRGMLEYLLAVKDASAQKAQTEAQKESAKKAGEVAKLQQGSKASGPAKVSGASPRGKMTLEEIERMPTAKWMAKPKEERERLLNAARGG